MYSPNAELLSARRRGQPFGDAEGPEDGDDPALGELLDRLGRGVRLALRIDDLHLHLAAGLQVQGEGDPVERLIRESFQVSRQRQHDADEIGAHAAPLRGLLHGAGALRVRALRLGGEHVARQVGRVGAVAHVKLDARQLESGRGPGGRSAIQIGDEPGDVLRGGRLEGMLEILAPRLPFRRRRRLEHARRPAHRLSPLAIARIRLGQGGRRLVLFPVAHLGGIDRRQRRCGLPQLRLDGGQLDHGRVAEGRRRTLFEELLQRRLRFLQLAGLGQRLAAAEERLVEQSAVSVALREGAELLGRRVIPALVIGGLRGIEFGPGSLLVRHLLPVDPHRARRSTGEEEQQQDRGHPLHGELPCTAFCRHPLLHNSWT
jgi:hypothetical protein